MKKKIIGWISLVLTIVMLCSVLSGCGKDNTATEEGVPTIVWCMPGKAQADVGMVVEKANAIIEPEIGAKLELRFIDDGAYQEKIRMFMASNADFDMCFVGYCNPYADAVKREGLLPIGDLLKKNAPDIMAEMPEYIWQSTKYNGEIYAIPNLQTMAAPNGFMVQADYIKESGFDISTINKMDDMEAFFEKIKPLADRDNKFVYRGKPGVVAWLYKFCEFIPGVPENCLAIRKDGKSTEIMKSFTLPEYKAALKKIRSWYEKGYIRPDISTVGNDDADFKQLKYIVSQTTAKPGAAESLSAQYNSEFEVFSFNPEYFSIGSANLTMTGLSINTKHAEKCLQLLNLVNKNDELYNLLCYGIEGVHYKLNEEGKVTYLDGGYRPRKAWAFGNQYHALLEEGQQDDVWDVTEEQNNRAIKSPLLGFNLNQQEVVNEVSQIQSIYQKYGPMFVGAVNPDDYYDSFIKELEEAGYSRLQEKVQAQVDAFLKNK